jgi:hypothetical protein
VEKLTIEENGISAYESHNEASCQSIPGTKWLPETLMGQKVAIKTLNITRFLPLDECESHHREVDQLTSSDQAHEPIQDNCCVI